MGAHAGPDQAQLGHRVVGRVALGLQPGDDAVERLAGGRQVVDGHRAGDVGVTLLADVLNDHVDVDVGVGQGREDVGGHARPVGHAAHRDLGLVGGVGHAADDRLFHGSIFFFHPGSLRI